MSEYVFKLPDLGEGTVESEIGEWFIKVGDQVKEEDIVGTMMTDKAAVELSSPVSGRVVKLAGKPGDKVAVGAPLVTFETEAAASGAETGCRLTKPPAPATARRRVLTSPAIRRRAREADIDLSAVQGSGPGGRITRADFDALAADSERPTVARPAEAVREIKVIGLRRMVAQRMAAAKRDIPHFAYVEELDITELEALRRHLNAQSPEQHLTLLPFLGLALIRALKAFPQCNATYDRDRKLVLQYEAVHLGIATQTPNGLKVPVVHHAQTLDLRELAREIKRVSAAARDNSAKQSELKGSTITITSLGKLGGIASTPIINAPEVGIVGVNRAVERPAVVNGQIAVRLMMNLSSSFDHRFVDGHDAAAMIQRIKEILENPATIFI